MDRIENNALYFRIEGCAKMSHTVEVATPEGPLTVTILETGVKSVIRLVCALVAMYDRHRVGVAVDFPAEVVAALDVLVVYCDLLRALNPDGPA